MSEPSLHSGEPRHDPIQGAILHVYDGIEEADNRLPRWWLASFLIAIVFGVGYWFYYHELELGPTPTEAYALEQASAGAAAEMADEAALLELAADPAAAAAGREVFATTCAACHGDQAQGEIGPNLTDDRWLHGGAPMDIYRSIRAGIDADDARIEGSAGMPGWGPSLGEARVREATAFLMSIRGTNVAGREAEGDAWMPAEDDADALDDGSDEGDEDDAEEAGEGSDEDDAEEAGEGSDEADPGEAEDRP